MSRRSGTARRAERKPVVVLAGEDANDRECLRLALEAMCPDMHGRLVEVSDSVRLRAASSGDPNARVDALVRKAHARAAREKADLACVIVHEDWDQADGSAADATHRRVQDALTSRAGNAHYVMAVAEVEAWLLQFPKALAVVASNWVVPKRHAGSDTGMIVDPKAVLGGISGRRRYSERDAPTVMAEAVRLKEIHLSGRNRSWDRLRADTVACCRQHLPGR